MVTRLDAGSSHRTCQGDVQLFPSLMHTAADAAGDSEGVPAAGEGAWLPLCSRAPFLLLSPPVTLKSEGPHCPRCAWTDTDVTSHKVWSSILFFLQGIRHCEWY